tara:strand:+ start:147 stop:398 length:252 start_codon:yes stop_codon:yes gene_type:complete
MEEGINTIMIDAMDKFMSSFNPMTFVKNVVSFNNSASGGLTQEYTQYSSTEYPNGQVVNDVNTVSVKTIEPPEKLGNTVDVRV